ncbi:MAG: gamma-glutamylcyclotransferase [Polaribacter sp.]|jgi:gamma-glutamylcyclotransferase
MASHRLLQRLPNAKISGIAQLKKHQLSFRKNHVGESGKCDIELTENSADIVIGVVYQISDDDRLILDQYEGLGWAYDSKPVEVITNTQEILSAFTYTALDIGTTILPFHWYKEHVLRGAVEHGFPAEYIQFIEHFESKPDPDQQRSESELSIYP